MCTRGGNDRLARQTGALQGIRNACDSMHHGNAACCSSGHRHQRDRRGHGPHVSGLGERMLRLPRLRHLLDQSPDFRNIPRGRSGGELDRSRETTRRHTGPPGGLAYRKDGKDRGKPDESGIRKLGCSSCLVLNGGRHARSSLDCCSWLHDGGGLNPCKLLGKRAEIVAGQAVMARKTKGTAGNP